MAGCGEARGGCLRGCANAWMRGYQRLRLRKRERERERERMVCVLFSGIFACNMCGFGGLTGIRITTSERL